MGMQKNSDPSKNPPPSRFRYQCWIFLKFCMPIWVHIEETKSLPTEIFYGYIFVCGQYSTRKCDYKIFLLVSFFSCLYGTPQLTPMQPNRDNCASHGSVRVDDEVSVGHVDFGCLRLVLAVEELGQTATLDRVDAGIIIN